MTNLEIVVGEWQNEDPTEKITEMTKADDQAAAQICWDSGKVHPLQEKQILIAVIAFFAFLLRLTYLFNFR